MAGKRVVVLGAGGAGRALAFGAVEKGAHVIIANRYHRCCEMTVHTGTRISTHVRVSSLSCTC